jgi:hypothetical protein
MYWRIDSSVDKGEVIVNYFIGSHTLRFSLNSASGAAFYVQIIFDEIGMHSV